MPDTLNGDQHRQRPEQSCITQIGSDADDFEFEDVGSNIDVSPTNTTSCDQQVNQAASAFGR